MRERCPQRGQHTEKLKKRDCSDFSLKYGGGRKKCTQNRTQYTQDRTATEQGGFAPYPELPSGSRTGHPKGIKNIKIIHNNIESIDGRNPWNDTRPGTVHEFHLQLQRNTMWRMFWRYVRAFATFLRDCSPNHCLSI